MVVRRREPVMKKQLYLEYIHVKNLLMGNLNSLHINQLIQSKNLMIL